MILRRRWIRIRIEEKLRVVQAPAVAFVDAGGHRHARLARSFADLVRGQGRHAHGFLDEPKVLASAEQRRGVWTRKSTGSRGLPSRSSRIFLTTLSTAPLRPYSTGLICTAAALTMVLTTLFLSGSRRGVPRAAFAQTNHS